MYKFGKRSKEKLATCHIDLQVIAERALANSQVDFSVTEGNRSLARQKMLFDKGKSKVDGIKRKGKHNYNPSLAFDFIAYVPGKKKLAYDLTHIMYLVGVLTCAAQELYREGKTKHFLRSGANWDRDGELRYDQTFFDAPHVELIKPK